MNQPPTPLGLQETIAESIYVTRPLLHRILPWLCTGSHRTLGVGRGCCWLGPCHSLLAAALLRQGPRVSFRDRQLASAAGVVGTSPPASSLGPPQHCLCMYSPGVSRAVLVPRGSVVSVPLVRHLWFLDYVFLVLSLGVWGQRSWKPWLLSAVLDISRSVRGRVFAVLEVSGG